jgi:hypothetical protein
MDIKHYLIVALAVLLAMAFIIRQLIRYFEYKQNCLSFFSTGRRLSRKRRNELTNDIESLYFEIHKLESVKFRNLKFLVFSQPDDALSTKMFNAAIGALTLIITGLAVGFSLLSTALSSIASQLSGSELSVMIKQFMDFLPNLMFILYLISTAAAGYLISLQLTDIKNQLTRKFIVAINQSETDRTLSPFEAQHPVQSASANHQPSEPQSGLLESP